MALFLASMNHNIFFDYTVIESNYALQIHIQIELVMAISNIVLVSIGFAPFYFVNFGHVTFTKYYGRQR